ncbi:helix-turn-helix transcriptional regulator [Streptomyces sp. NPDC051320]|uniref:helix-turn-helix transcriptional regulator n=1 Tax=Streptomyces sp. NPDC051320 TaxID=3154644 RepID=UPI003427A367
MNEDPRAFRHRRIEGGLSQAALARRLGIGRSRICDVEKGRPGRGLAPKHLKAAADIFGCTVHDLLLPEDDGSDGTGVRSVA